MTDRTFVQGLADWLQEGHARYLDLGVEPEEIKAAGGRFIEGLRLGSPPIHADLLSESDIELFRSACQRLVSGPDVLERLRDGEAFFQFVSRVAWPEPEFEERAELLWECALAMWTSARSTGDSQLADLWLKRLAVVFESLGPIREALLLSLKAERGSSRESLVAAWLWMVADMEKTPSEVLAVASNLHADLTARAHEDATEQELRFFRGEIAMRAGVACRVLARRREAREWFGRAAKELESESSGSADRARLVYQELALGLEERRFEWVTDQLPSLVEAFKKLNMPEDLLKARFLEGIVLMESERLDEAAVLYRELYGRSVALGTQRLAATASYNLVQLYGMMGETDAAFAEAAVAVPLLRRLGNRVGLAKIQWGLGGLLRTQGKLEAAIENYRAAQGEFRDIGMRADLAALHLVIADLLIERGKEADAMSEVLAALPIIEEEQMVPEGMAALALLRESVRARRLNRQALRDLHGYFEELA